MEAVEGRRVARDLSVAALTGAPVLPSPAPLPVGAASGGGAFMCDTEALSGRITLFLLGGSETAAGTVRISTGTSIIGLSTFSGDHNYLAVNSAGVVGVWTDRGLANNDIFAVTGMR